MKKFWKDPSNINALMGIGTLLGQDGKEVFIYRPLTGWYRLVDLVQYFKGKRGGWGKVVRKGF